MRKIVLFLIIVFLGLAIAGVWYWKTNIYSKEILKLEILGPNTAQAGDEVEYLVKFKNNGKVRLENAELIFEYPANAVPSKIILATSTDRTGQFAGRVTQTIDDIYPGEERVMSFKARLFGKENDKLEAKVWASYQPKGLKARYESKTSFISQIQFVPLTFEFDLPAKIEPGDDLEFSLNYFSNMQASLDNMRVKIIYPNGFTFITAKPKPLDQTEWKPAALSPADGGRITISGVLDGQEGEGKMFQAQLGVIKDNNFIILKEASQTVQIAQPALRVSQMINGSQNYIANVGDLLHYEIFFQNIGNKAIEKKFLLLNLEGDFFDLTTLKTTNGEVGRGDNSIIWDWKNVTDLRYLDPGEEGKVEFWIQAKDGSAGRKMVNPILAEKITIGGTQKSFETKVNSVAGVLQSAYFQDDKFNSSGPSQISASTTGSTFTITWELDNSWNNLTNVKIKAILPGNVRPTGRMLPVDAKFTFDSTSREVIWNVGDLSAYSASENGGMVLWFQVEADQPFDGNSILIGEADILGQDVFTSDIISEKCKALTISSAAVAPQAPPASNETPTQ